MLNDIVESLIKLNFTKQEAEVLTCLYSGNRLTAKQISAKTGIPKISVLYIANKLLEKNLIEKRQSDNLFEFLPRSTDQLADLVEKQIKYLDSEKKQALRLIKKAKSYTANVAGQVVFYTDPMEIKILRSQLLEDALVKIVKKEYYPNIAVEKFATSMYFYWVSVRHNFVLRAESEAVFDKFKDFFIKLDENNIS